MSDGNKDYLWDIYSEKYNVLCSKLIDAGIDYNLLSEVIEAREMVGFKNISCQSICQSQA